MIDTITWNLGGYSTMVGVNTYNYYNYERGTEVYTGRPKLWQGEIGLMYPSDYGYATSGGTTLDRKSCLEKDLYSWNSSSSSVSYKTDCAYNDWLLNKGKWQWTLMAYSGDNRNAFVVHSNGDVGNGNVKDATAVAPVLYLKSNVQIVKGIGTTEDPYILK